MPIRAGHRIEATNIGGLQQYGLTSGASCWTARIAMFERALAIDPTTSGPAGWNLAETAKLISGD